MKNICEDCLGVGKLYVASLSSRVPSLSYKNNRIGLPNLVPCKVSPVKLHLTCPLKLLSPAAETAACRCHPAAGG